MKMESKKLEINKLNGKVELQPEDRPVFIPQGRGQPQWVDQDDHERRSHEEYRREDAIAGSSSEGARWCPDPAADLRDKLENVLKALPEQGKSPIPEDRKLLEKDGVEVRLNVKENLEIGIKIDLRENADYIKKFYETMTAIKSSHADLNRLKVRIA